MKNLIQYYFRTFFEQRRSFKILILVLLSYGLTFGGYKLISSHADIPDQAQILVFRKDFSQGMSVGPGDLQIVWKSVPEGIDAYVGPTERVKLKDLPLIQTVAKGTPVKKTHFLFPGENWTHKLGSDFRSVWLPHSQPRHFFTAGSQLDLYSRSGHRLAANVTLVDNQETGYLVVVKKSLLPRILSVLHSGTEVVALYRHAGPSEPVAKRHLVVETGSAWVE